MPNLVNRLISAEYAEIFAKSQGVVFFSLGGVTVKELEKLRNQLARDGARIRMVRTSLMRRAMAERGYEASAELLAGNTGIVHGSLESAIAAVKLFTSPEVKKPGKIAVRGAVFDRVLLGAKDALALANLPDKRTLRGMLVGCIQAPARNLAALLAAVPSSTARVLQARADQQGAADPGGTPPAP